MKMRVHLTLTAADRKRYLAHAVEVPVAARALRIVLDFEPVMAGDVPNMLCLSVFDPGGFRGAGHRHRTGKAHEVVITESWATPGYLPGPIRPGAWNVEIDTHMVHGAAGCRAELSVEALTAPPEPPPTGPDAPAAEPRTAAPPLPPAPAGWLRGDIHAHSLHSDARWSVDDLVRAARGVGLDFVTLSDHNTVSGLTELDAHDLVTLPAMELTTYWGHALALGLRGWTDWRTGLDGLDIGRVAGEVARKGGVFVIAHPMSEGDPTCTGCRWHYPDASPGPAHHVEIFNGGLSEVRNEEALRLWYGWLNAGHTVFATAGTDAHEPADMVRGKRFNVIRSPARTAASVFDALARGHSYLSRGPHLDLQVLPADGGGVRPGGAVPAGAVEVEGAWRDAEPGARVRLVVNGKVRLEWAADETAVTAPSAEGGDGARTGGGRADLRLAPASWCVLELRDPLGELAAVTNPVWASGRRGMA